MSLSLNDQRNAFRVRPLDFIDWIDEPVCRALQLAPPSLTVSIHIHITRGSAAIQRGTGHDGREVRQRRDPRSASAESTEMGDMLAFDSVRVENGRPDLAKMLGEEVQSATRKLSVSGESCITELSSHILIHMRYSTAVCGSLGMAQSVRQALRFPVSSPSNVLRGGPSVSLFVETYGYT